MSEEPTIQEVKEYFSKLPLMTEHVREAGLDAIYTLEEKGLTKKEIVRRIKKNRTTFQRMISGEVKFSPGMLYALYELEKQVVKEGEQ